MRTFLIGAGAPFPDMMEKHVVERRMCQAVAGFRPDLILVLFGHRLSPKTVRALRRVHAGPIAGWCQDQTITLGRPHLLAQATIRSSSSTTTWSACSANMRAFRFTTCTRPAIRGSTGACHVHVDFIVNGVDTGRVGMLDGESPGWILAGFVPRAVGLTQPDAFLVQRSNRELGLSASRAIFVPTIQLGDRYWNFGMLGALLDTAAIRVVFGKLSVVLDAARLTLPRFMVFIFGTYYLAIQFEDRVTPQYTIFVCLVLLACFANLVMQQLRVVWTRANGSLPQTLASAAQSSAGASPAGTVPTKLHVVSRRLAT